MKYMSLASPRTYLNVNLHVADLSINSLSLRGVLFPTLFSGGFCTRLAVIEQLLEKYAYKRAYLPLLITRVVLMSQASHGLGGLRNRFRKLKHGDSQPTPETSQDIQLENAELAKNSGRPPPINYATKPTLQAKPVPNQSTAQNIDLPISASIEIQAGQSESSENVFQYPLPATVPKFSTRSHVLLPKSVRTCSESGRAIQTNKFYSNLYLGSQRGQIYPLPYVLKFSGYGLDVGHTDEDQQVFGPDPHGQDAQYVFAPVGIVSMSFTATEKPDQIHLTDLKQFSINIKFTSNACAGSIQFPIVRGSGFINATYEMLTPELHSGIMIRDLQYLGKDERQKWRFMLEDGKMWCLYASGSSMLDLELNSNSVVRSRRVWSGLLQLAKIPSNDPNAERLFDQAAGTYSSSITLTGNVGVSAHYSFNHKKIGSGPLLIYALPHHIASCNTLTRACVQNYRLASPCNGLMTLISADSWHMTEQLPSERHLSACPEVHPESLSFLQAVISEDAEQDFDALIRVDSMYFSGKALNKLAQLTILAARTEHQRYRTLVASLERNIMFFVDNQQEYSLIYENTWGGLVSSQGFTDRGDGSDFGNTWYNDHHYHYGYHVSSVAIYLSLVQESASRESIVQWALTLIRDVASPVADRWFPAYRNMDWFVGHSWSKGIYESADGKDEESSSEDYHFTYACNLFATVVGDSALRDRSLIQLAVQRRSLQSYMLYTPENQCMPAKMIKNVVSGIKFENKIDYVGGQISEKSKLTALDNLFWSKQRIHSRNPYVTTHPDDALLP